MIFLILICFTFNFVSSVKWTLLSGNLSSCNEKTEIGTAGMDIFSSEVTPGSRNGPGFFIFTTEHGLLLVEGNGFDEHLNESSFYGLGQFNFEYSLDQNLWRYRFFSNREAAYEIYYTQENSKINFARDGSSCWKYFDPTDQTDYIYLYGGFGFAFIDDGRGYWNDVRRMKIESNTWETVVIPHLPYYMVNINTTNHGNRGEFKSSYSPFPRTYSVVANSKENPHIAWFFGGYYHGVLFNDLWQFNVETEEFAWMGGSFLYPVVINPPTNDKGNFMESYIPTPSIWSQCWSVGEDFYLYGGIVYGYSNYLSEFWVYKQTELKWALLGGGDENIVCTYPTIQDRFYGESYAFPGARNQGSSFVDPLNSDYLWLFGGSVPYSYYLKDMWVYSISRNEWNYFAEPNTIEESVQGVRLMTMTVEDNPPVAYYFGGYTENYVSSDTLWKIEEFAVHSCWGYDKYDDLTCSGLGNCSANNTCDCQTGYRSHYPGCIPMCEGNCSNHGSCVGIDVCECDENYYSGNCSIWKCNDIYNNDTSVCNERGDCTSFDKCKCNKPYFGDDCELFYCFNISKILNESCGAGSCIAPDQCECGEYEGSMCEKWRCNGKQNNETNVCNYPNGTCVSPDLCECEEGYYGNDCQFWSCFSVNYDNETVCNNHGICFGKDQCSCDDGYYGDMCTDHNSVFGAGEFFSSFWWIFLLIGLCILCFVLTGIVIGVIILVRVVQMQKKVKTYKDVVGEDELEIMKMEKEMEGKEEKAKIKVNKSLYEIEYNEIKLVKAIGTGGSETTIYEALWKGRDICIKIFKTAQLTNQAYFDEFEKEVSIVSSLSHPSILRFFGCCLKLPKIGIVMELCRNGDLAHYMTDYPGCFKIHHKIKILADIASGMDYLHGRKIIHRDLKAQNILLTKELGPKIIDFGLSKIVDKENAKKGLTKYTGTSVYMAPEVVTGNDYTNKCDVFSFAILTWEVLHDSFHPYGTNLKFNVELKVSKNPDFRPKVDDERFVLQKWLINLMKKCWDHNPDIRPTFEQIFKILNDSHQKLTGKKFKAKTSIEDNSFGTRSMAPQYGNTGPSIVDRNSIVKEFPLSGDAMKRVQDGILSQEKRSQKVIDDLPKTGDFFRENGSPKTPQGSLNGDSGSGKYVDETNLPKTNEFFDSQKVNEERKLKRKELREKRKKEREAILKSSVHGK